MKTALLVSVIDPSLGGVLLRGQKGTAKTAVVRGLAQMLNLRNNSSTESVPLVELPLGAGEDRLIGTLHLETALKTGERKFEPGLLAEADKGILYVDEVNLLEAHLVDILLDVSVSGINRVEREGLSHEHPARFVLVGTMNPEEGDLRPQFTDRFALCIDVLAENNLDDRKEIIRRRLEFEKDPEEFYGQYLDDEKVLARQVFEAREKLHLIPVLEEAWNTAVAIALRSGTPGHRADIAMIKTARALAAFLEISEVNSQLVQSAAYLVLPHRLGIESIFGDSSSPEERIRAAIDGKPIQSQEEFDETDFSDEELEAMQTPGPAAAGSMVFEFLKKKLRPV